MKIEFAQGHPMAGNSIKDKKKYDALKRKAISNARAARIANPGPASSRKASHAGRVSETSR
jgi:hypothetical protein